MFTTGIGGSSTGSAVPAAGSGNTTSGGEDPLLRYTVGFGALTFLRSSVVGPAGTSGPVTSDSSMPAESVGVLVGRSRGVATGT